MKDKLGTKGLLSDDNRSVAQFEENGMVYKGVNQQRHRVLRYDVDGKMITQGKKCDKALALPDLNTLYLIELKGCDLKKAATQLFETIKVLDHKLDGVVVHGRAVCSRIPKPDIRSTQVVRLERELAKRKGSFKKNSKVIEERI